MLHHPEACGLKGAAASAIEQFTTMIRSFQIMLEKQNAYDVAFAVGKHTGLVQELYNDKSVEGLAPLRKRTGTPELYQRVYRNTG